MKFIPAEIISGEMWRPIARLSGVYEVSDHGRIRRIHKKRGTEIGWVLKPRLNSDGYPYVTMSKIDGSRICMQVIHKMVAEAFIGERPLGYEIDHKDGDKENNHKSNLEYVTQLENLSRKKNLGLNAVGERNFMTTLTQQEVIYVRKLWDLGYAQKDIAWAFGLSTSGICGIINRLTWKHV